ncbi:MAG: GMC family oxidoreductase [Gaiellales bacterium]
MEPAPSTAGYRTRRCRRGRGPPSGATIITVASGSASALSELGDLGEDLPDTRNRVELDPERVDSAGLAGARIAYSVSENSRRLLRFHVERAKESLLEAGATSVDSLTVMRSAGWHLLGTARMGTDPATSVVDPWGRAHDVGNLYVVDGSVFVTAGGVNPTNTISSLALRIADRLVERRADQRVPA